MAEPEAPELLPCPKCGEPGRIRHDTSSDYVDHWRFIPQCSDDGCIEGAHFRTEEQAAAWWNRRALVSPAVTAPDGADDDFAKSIAAFNELAAVTPDLDFDEERPVTAEPVAFAPKGHIERYLAGKENGACWVYSGPVDENSVALYALPVDSAGEAGWRPMDSAPKDFVTTVDLWARGERYPDCSWMRPTYGPKEYRWCYHSGDDCNGPIYDEVREPTHWMPLPVPPAGQKP